MKQNKYSLRTSQLGWQKATVFCTRKPQTTNNICILYFISKQGSLNTKCKKQNFTNSKESTVLYSGMKALTAESILCSCHTCVSLTRCFLWINCLNGTTRFLSHVNNVFEIHDNSGHNTSKKIFYSKKIKWLLHKECSIAKKHLQNAAFLLTLSFIEMNCIVIWSYNCVCLFSILYYD